MEHVRTLSVAVIGGGPAGLMAAECLASAGHAVELFDAMPSVGRKFLLAGKGGMNLTHSEPSERFLSRYGAAADRFAPLLEQFGPDHLRQWAAGLGIETFVGSSGRVFPTDFKAAPLLRAWLRRLKGLGVRFHVRHRWLGWDGGGRLIFSQGEPVAARATVLALGGASWPRLGSDGAWVPLLAEAGVAVKPLLPSNCGFDVGWSPFFAERFAGTPLKRVCLHFDERAVPGDLIVTATGLEGGPLYALSGPLRDAIASQGAAVLDIDLRPDLPRERLAQALARPRGSRSLSSHLERATGLKGAAAALLRECLPSPLPDGQLLAQAIKALPVRLSAPRPIAEAISSAGGVAWDQLDQDLMVRQRPGLFVCGEMLDWEAPTGGYLLTGCFSTGHAAGQGVARWLSAIQHINRV